MTSSFAPTITSGTSFPITFKTLPCAAGTKITTTLDGKSPAKIAEENRHQDEGDDYGEGDDSYQGPDFVPVIPLPDEVDVVTGEENEKVLFDARCKLYRFMDKEWKERGLGNIRILFCDQKKLSRIVMRREHVLKVCANHHINLSMSVKINQEKPTMLTWQAMDFTDGEAHMENLCARFKTEELAKDFHDKFNKAKQMVKSEKSPVPKTSAKPSGNKNGTKDLAEKFKAKAGTWECTVCLINNAADTVMCQACATIKPGAEQPKEDKKVPVMVTSFGAGGGLSFGSSTSFGGFQFGNKQADLTKVSKPTSTDAQKLGDASSTTDSNKPSLFGTSEGNTVGGFTFSSKPIITKLVDVKEDNTKEAYSKSNAISKTTPFSTFSFSPSKPEPKASTSTIASTTKTKSLVSTTSSSGALFDTPSTTLTSVGLFGIPSTVNTTTATAATGIFGKSTSSDNSEESSSVFGASINALTSSSTGLVGTPSTSTAVLSGLFSTPSATTASSTGMFGTGSTSTTPPKGLLWAPPVSSGIFGTPSTESKVSGTPSFDSLVENSTKNGIFSDNQRSERIFKSGGELFKHAEKIPHNNDSEKTEAATEGDDHNVSAEYEPDVDFKPVIPLPSLVEVKTGEEEEEKLFGERSKLFRMDMETKQWKERGIGELKILKHKESGHVRILMRREQVLKLCANHQLSSDMSLKAMASSDRAWCWIAQDYAEGELRNEQLAAKFKTPELAETFKEAFEEAQKNIINTPEKKPRSSQVSAAVVLSDKFKAKEGDWDCDMCYVRNSGNNDKCLACESVRPGVTSKQKANIVPKQSSGTVAFGKEGGFTVLSLSSNNETSTKTGSFSFSSFGTKPESKSVDTPASFSFTSSKPVDTASSFSFIPSKPVDTPSTPFSFTPSKPVDTPSTPFSFTPSKPATDNTSCKPFSFGTPSNLSFNTPQKNATADTTKLPTSPHYYENHEDDEPDIDFKPVIEMPDKINVVTGEEDELTLYSHRSKLYRFVNNDWKERGLGDLKILQHKQSYRVRLLMRREQVLKLCLNHYLSDDMEIKPMSNSDNKAWIWYANDFSEGESKHEQFAARFKNAEISSQFKQAFEDAKKVDGIEPGISSGDAKPDAELAASSESTSVSKQDNATSKTQVSEFKFKSPSVFGSSANNSPIIFGGNAGASPNVFGGSANNSPSVFGGNAGASPNVFGGSANNSPSVFGGDATGPTLKFDTSNTPPDKSKVGESPLHRQGSGSLLEKLLVSPKTGEKKYVISIYGKICGIG